MSCVHAPKTGAAALEIDDGVAALLDAPAPDIAGKLRWYEESRAPQLRTFGAAPDQLDPDQKLAFKVYANKDALLATLAEFDDHAERELRDAAARVDALCGPLPKTRLIFGVTRSNDPVFRSRDAILINARSPLLQSADARSTRFTGELVRAALAHREPKPLASPLANSLFLEGAALFAARQIVPSVSETELLGVDGSTLELFRKRQALLAREALAAMDSSSPAGEARFFDPSLKDPLIPRGAGRFLADRIYQQLAMQLGSTKKPLMLSGAEFSRRARVALQSL